MAQKLKIDWTSFTNKEKTLWIFSVILITVSFFYFDRGNYLSLAASLIGVTSLILNAKGHPMGQVLMVIFSILYGIISYSFAYYGEMITYLAMTGPMAAMAFISWMKNTDKDKQEVKIAELSKTETLILWGGGLAVTFIFYFILKYFRTSYLYFSTLSVLTSFLAVYLTYKRSIYFAFAYAMNDLVLIVLWGLASLENPSYICVVICFILFFINDMYGFISWKERKKQQMQQELSYSQAG